MNTNTIKTIEAHPELDKAVCKLVELVVRTRDRDGHGSTGVTILHKGKDKPLRYRELLDVVYN